MTARCGALAAGVLIAWGLKHLYAGAQAEDLRWMLGLTTALVGVVTRTTFEWLPGEGYFSRDQMFLIEKSCAGINFMVAAFGMVLVSLVHRVESARSAARAVGVSLLASYAAAVVVNAVRIAVAIWLAAHPAALSSFDAAAVHRVEGVTVYFAGLVLLHEVVRRASARGVPTGGLP